MNPSVPARIHVLLARESPTAVVIRRGPSRRTALVGWDRATDTFRVGQWLHGRIYERRCDLSPDGAHVIYFAMNGRWSSPSLGSWTAISRAPYLKAIAFFPKGDGWNGGGLFLSNDTYWLNDGCGQAATRDTSRLTRSTSFPWHEHYGGECPGVYYIRLQRDGWTMTSTRPDGAGGRITLFEKPVADTWVLRKRAHATIRRAEGRGCYFDEHSLVDSLTGQSLDFPAWEWADVDGSRLVWAEGGKLLAGRIGPAGLVDTWVLHDLDPLRPERLQAPH